MALGLLLIFYVGISVISIGGLLGLYLVKGEKVKKVLFYLMSAWGIALSALQAISLPTTWIAQRVMGLAPGVLCIAALIVHLKAGNGRQKMAAYLLLTVAVAADVLQFIIR